MTLQSKTFSAIKWTGASAALRAILQLLQVVVLTRLLSPEDYGLAAIIIVLINISSTLSDFGISSALVQRQKITEVQRSSLYWLSVGFGLAMTLLLCALSPIVVWVVEEPKLQALLLAGSNVLWIGALGQQIRITAEKELSFRPVVLVEITSAILAFSIAVIAAWRGSGVWSLVFASLAAAAFNSIGAWLMYSKGWRPMLRFSISQVRHLVTFGGIVLSNNIVNQISLSLDIFIGARILGATQIGLYSVPRNLCLQIQSAVNPVFTRVGFPLIAQVQDNEKQVREVFSRILNLTSTINSPIYIWLFGFSNDVIVTFFGDKWQEVDQVLKTLAIWALFRAIGNPVGIILIGTGRAMLSLKWSASLLFIIPPCTLLGANWGLEALAITMAALMTVLFLPAWYFLVQPICRLAFNKYFWTAYRPIVLSAISVGASYFLTSFFDETLFRLSLGMIITFTFYVSITLLFNRNIIVILKPLLVRSK